VARTIARNEGAISGFYRGLTPNIIGNSVSWALYFLWYGKIKDGLSIYYGEERALGSLDYFVASGASGKAPAVQIRHLHRC
jgi:solute carrier family 25 (mitochondrial folate transporter), member 32